MVTIVKNVAVNRDILSVDRHYYDLFVDDKAIKGVFIWNTGATFRGLFALFKDKRKSARLEAMSADDLIADDKKNFYVDFDDINGVVSDDLHKEIQMLTSSEIITILVRKVSDYKVLLEALNNKLGDKMHPREVEVKMSLKQGY